MEFVLLKDWGEHKKGNKVSITDSSVVEAGLKAGLFQEEKKEEKKVKAEK